jgi:hypothetical protein
MITISLSTEDLTKVRLAPSPLWETVISFGVLLHQGRETVHAPWATRARRTLAGCRDVLPLTPSTSRTEASIGPATVHVARSNTSAATASRRYADGKPNE